MMKPFYQKLKPIVSTILALVVGYLTLSISTALLYAVWLSGEEHTITSQFLAFAAVCGLGFATLSGYLTALVAQRSPIAHAAGFSLLLTVIWAISTFLGGAREPLLIAFLNIAIAIAGVMTGGLLRQLQISGKLSRSTETLTEE